MHVPSPRYAALFATAALLLTAGCSGGGSSMAPTSTQPMTPAQSTSHAPSGFKWIPGPAVIGPMLVATAHRGAPGVVPKKTAQILYVADAGNNVVEMYD